MKENIILIILSIYFFSPLHAMLKPTTKPAPAIPKESFSFRDYIKNTRDKNDTNFFNWRVKHFGKHFDFSNLKLTDLADFQKVPELINRKDDTNTVADLTKVETLSLYGNKFTTINPQLFPALPALKTLTLNKNQITSIAPRSFAQFPELIYLQLSNNPLSSLNASAFQGLNNLSDLFLSQAELQTLPDDIFQFAPKLQRIMLNDNKLTQLNPNIFRGLPQLKTVNLIGNALSETNKKELKDAYPNVKFIF